MALLAGMGESLGAVNCCVVSCCGSFPGFLLSQFRRVARCLAINNQRRDFERCGLALPPGTASVAWGTARQGADRGSTLQSRVLVRWCCAGRAELIARSPGSASRGIRFAKVTPPYLNGQPTAVRPLEVFGSTCRYTTIESQSNGPRRYPILLGTILITVVCSSPLLISSGTIMAVALQDLDAHEQPSNELRATWKSYSRTDHSEFVNHPDIDDIHIPEKAAEFQQSGIIPSAKIVSAIQQIEGPNWSANDVVKDAPIYFHPLLPGVHRTPSRSISPRLTRLRTTHRAFVSTCQYPEGTTFSHGPPRSQ